MKLVQVNWKKANALGKQVVSWGSIIGALFALAQIANSAVSQDNELFTLHISLIILIIGLSIILLISLQFERQLLEENNRLQNIKEDNDRLRYYYTHIIKCHYNISQEIACLFSRLNNDIVRIDFSNNSQRNAQSRELFLHFLGNVREIFNKATGHDCAVCIKVLVSDTENGNGNETLKTRVYFRDHFSYTIRKNNYNHRETQPVYRDTALLHILSEENNDDYFLENDLKARASGENYLNNNPHWKAHYNATLVVPIRHENKEEKIQKEKPLGFLCVDNHHGRFNVHSHYTLSVLSNLCYLIMSKVSEYQSEYIRASNGGID